MTSSIRLRDADARQERAERILDAARDLLLKWGYNRVTIDDVKPGNATAFNGESITVSAEVHGLRDGEPVLLHYFGGLSIAETAGHLEITAGATKTRLWRARQALRGKLETMKRPG